MKVLFIFSLLLFLSIECSQAQSVSIKGKVISSGGEPIKNVKVALYQLYIMDISKSNGEYLLKSVPVGKQKLMAYSSGYRLVDIEIENLRKDTTITIVLEVWEEALEEVTITADFAKTFGLTRLQSVQDFAINEGKKTEVIKLSEMTINAATNNARQLYSKVAGLTIWESDGAGIQLGIGGRGLSPNRTSSFNTRQNGYDISADALGYPESYYTPPAEALDEIQIVRGAASLQYGTQFGGLLNFKFKEGNSEKRVDILSRQSIGSWGFLSNFTSLSGSSNDNSIKYYGYYNYKQGDGWRPNSNFNYHNGYVSVQFDLNESWKIGFDLTKMHYLAKQPGGLTDRLFEENPLQSLRNRNWFLVDWNMLAVNATYTFSGLTQINSKTFGLHAKRQSLGNLERINVFDFGENRTLIKGRFNNIGNETRLIHRYHLGGEVQVLATGFRIYKGNTNAKQGDGNNLSNADFSFINPNDVENSDYLFPNYNYAVFMEHLFQINKKVSITPGVRWEHIRTESNGYYKQVVKDGAGNIIVNNKIQESDERVRSFLLMGVGFSYKPVQQTEFYANISQNYRAINFTDLRIVNPNFVVDPFIKDEKGYTADLGMRGRVSDWFNYEMTAFYLSYNGKIGQVLKVNQPPLYTDYRFRGNIADSRNIGLEAFGEVDMTSLMSWNVDKQWTAFVNISAVDARYINSEDETIQDKYVEMVPPLTVRTGTSLKVADWSFDIQWSYTAEHFSDATNTRRSSTAVEGVILSYQIVDISAKYVYKRYILELSINNVLNAYYFTRRAEAYPGPGIIPADGRGFFTTLQIVL